MSTNPPGPNGTIRTISFDTASMTALDATERLFDAVGIKSNRSLIVRQAVLDFAETIQRELQDGPGRRQAAQGVAVRMSRLRKCQPAA